MVFTGSYWNPRLRAGQATALEATKVPLAQAHGAKPLVCCRTPARCPISQRVSLWLAFQSRPDIGRGPDGAGTAAALPGARIAAALPLSIFPRRSGAPAPRGAAQASIKDGYAIVVTDGAGDFDVVGDARAGSSPALVVVPGTVVRPLALHGA